MLDSVARAHRVQSTLSLLHTDEGLLIESTEPAHRVQSIHPPFDLPLFSFRAGTYKEPRASPPPWSLYRERAGAGYHVNSNAAA